MPADPNILAQLQTLWGEPVTEATSETDAESAIVAFEWLPSPIPPTRLTLSDNGCKLSYMTTRRKKSKTLTETLQQAIADSGLPFIELERQTGVIRQSLMKFARNEQTLFLDAADKLAEFFGLELGPTSKVTTTAKVTSKRKVE